MKILIIISFLLFSGNIISGQKIIIEEQKRNQFKMTFNDSLISSPKQLYDILKTKNNSNKILKRAKIKGIVGAISSITGYGFLGAGLGALLSKQNERAVRFSGIAAGLIVLKFPIDRSASKTVIKSIDVYNNSISE